MMYRISVKIQVLSVKGSNVFKNDSLEDNSESFLSMVSKFFKNLYRNNLNHECPGSG
jgi:hypothetical protein